MANMSKARRKNVLATLRTNGCRCEPNIIAVGPVGPGLVTCVRIQHDCWCPLLHRVRASRN
jgi:hypothetical protein